MGVKIVEVKDKSTLKDFISFPDSLYRDNEYYIPPLHKGEIETLSKDNPAFEYCDSAYWVARRNGKTVGRIAGIINSRYNDKEQRKLARFGWLDFEEDEEVLTELMTTFEAWARDKGMEKTHGPLGFISFDNSGVLVEGFEEMPTSFGKYNYAYYDGMLKKQGYEKEIDWIEFQVTMPDKIPDRISKVAGLLKKRYGIRHAELTSRKELLKYADELFDLLNESYHHLYGFNPLTNKQIENLKDKFLGFIDPEYISIVLDDKDQIIGFGIAMPSLSEALKKSGGNLFPLGYLRVWRALKKNDLADLLLLGVKPEFQNKGITALIFEKIGETFLKNKIKFFETTRELEDNHSVTQLWSKLEHRQHKRARCYVKEL